MEYLALLLLLIPLVYASIHVLISTIGINKKIAKSQKQLPPGPSPFPIIGNILELTKNQPHIALTNLSQTYGPIMSLKLGQITTIVISSPQLAKQILQKYDQIFSYRTIPDSYKTLDHTIVSVIWLPPTTPQWRNLRRFCATKVFSTQKLDSTKDLRQKKVLELMDYVNEKCNKGESLDIGEACFITVLNSISNTFFSMDLAHYNNYSNKAQEFKDLIRGVMEGGRPNVVDFFPILHVLDPQGARAKMTKIFEKLITCFDGVVEERLQSRGLKEAESKDCNKNDVLDSVLEENSQLSRIEVLHLFLDLFVAGIDTTSSTIEWAMTELLRNPQKAKKVRNEIQQVFGKDHQQIEESHISELPFLRAVIKETLRLHPPAPFLVPHKSHEHVELCGYMVPKNAQILVNVWAMGRDSRIWTNPNEFKPERFLESHIDFKGQDFELTPFGGGRRICPGLPLANRTIHIVLASLLHRYDWKLSNGLKIEDMDMSEKFGLTLNKAQPLHVIPIQA